MRFDCGFAELLPLVVGLVDVVYVVPPAPPEAGHHLVQHGGLRGIAEDVALSPVVPLGHPTPPLLTPTHYWPNPRSPVE